MAATDAAFVTLAGRGEAELRIRGSRFLGFAAPAETEGAARELLTSLQRLHFDATHHCSAWRFRDGVWRANDAGEPGGSAGAPILGALESVGVTDAAVVVVRYFGGTKLGVGGLVRAYGDSAAAALDAAPRREGVPAARIRIRYDYTHTAAVMRVLEAGRAAAIEHGFVEGGNGGLVTATMPLATLEEATLSLQEQTAGDVAPEALGHDILYRVLPSAPAGSA